MGERNTAFAQKAIAVSLSTSEVWLCPMKVSDMEQKWYNMRYNMSGEMHMRRRRDAKMRYSVAYPTCAERFVDLETSRLWIDGGGHEICE